MKFCKFRMKCGKTFLSVLFCLGYLTVLADPDKQALKYLEEGELEKARQQIKKSLEKDSLSATPHYLVSRLLTEIAYPGYNLDSAYRQIRHAGRLWPAMDQKEKARSARIGVDSLAIRSQRKHLESLAFQRARQKMTLSSLQNFLEYYASDSLSAPAKHLRDSLAFLQAEATGTWEAYRNFYQAYPEARQVTEATEKYHQLLYRSRTASGTLQELRQFLEQVKDSPYREKVEKQVLLLMTAGRGKESYLDFLRQYPRSALANLAREAVTYQMSVSQLHTGLGKIYADSVEKQQQQDLLHLVPFLEDDHYGFFSATDGRVVLPAVYDRTDPEYYCRLVTETFLTVEKNGRKYLADKSGNSPGKDAAFGKHLGKGLYVTSSNGKYGVIFRSGYRILPAAFSQIELQGNFLLAKAHGKWGVYSLLGLEMQKPVFSSVKVLPGNSIITELNKLYHITACKDIRDGKLDAARQQHRLEDYELIGEDYLLVFDGKTEALYTQDLEEIIAPQEAEIYVESGLVYTRSKWGVRILGDNQVYERIKTGQRGYAVLKNGAWQLVTTPATLTNLDSVHFLTDSLIFIVRNGKKEIHGPGKQIIKPEETEKPEVILSSLDNGPSGYLKLAAPGGKRMRIYSPGGRFLLETVNSSVTTVTGTWFLLRNKRGYKLLKSNGEDVMEDYFSLLEPEITDYGMVFHLLDKDKLGLYDPKTELKIPAVYTAKIKKAGKSTYLVSTRSGWQIYRSGTKPHSSAYQEIRVLNDSLVIVKDSGSYQLLETRTGNVQLSAILQIERTADGPGFSQFKYRQAKGFGLLDSRYGVLAEGLYNEISNLGTREKPYYLLERYLPDSEFYILTYMNSHGKKVKSIAYKDTDYEKIICE